MKTNIFVVNFFSQSAFRTHGVAKHFKEQNKKRIMTIG